MSVGTAYCASRQQRGVTLVELLVATTVSLLIIGAMGSFVQVTTESKMALDDQIEVSREAGFAMDRIVRIVSHSRRLALPLADNPATNWREHVREQTVPASPPEGDSALATAVLAVTPPEFLDLDFNGIPDSDNDGDGRIDEDPSGDQGFDAAPGVPLVDDDGNGIVDDAVVGGALNDDESAGGSDEDPVNNTDDDGDGSVDEDPSGDLNGDGCPGVCGVDDDGDGLVDEGALMDDDEDGLANEDWIDVLVFYLDNGVLKERLPVPWDESGDAAVSGLDFIVSDIAEGVTALSFERVAAGASGIVLVDIELQLSRADGQTISLNRRVRVGGAL